MIDLTKKATMATVKSFVRKNMSALFIDKKTNFDSSQDGVRACEDRGFTPVRKAGFPENTMGIAGAWIVGQSRDYITPFRKDGFEGYQVHNCCGSFSVVVKSA